MVLLNNAFGYLELETEGVWTGSKPEDMRAPKQSVNEKETFSSALSFEFHNSQTRLSAFSTCSLSLSSSHTYFDLPISQPSISTAADSH